MKMFPAQFYSMGCSSGARVTEVVMTLGYDMGRKSGVCVCMHIYVNWWACAHKHKVINPQQKRLKQNSTNRCWKQESKT